jgi:beta-phosphoglucomutase-like phosphatase (HAD superfamily)
MTSLPGKPDPAIYLLAAKRLGLTPETLFAVEDAVSGVRSATAAGLKCVGVASATHAESLRAAGADPVVPDFRTLSVNQLQAGFE